MSGKLPAPASASARGDWARTQAALLEMEFSCERSESEQLRQTAGTAELQRRGVCLTRLCVAGVRTGLKGRLLIDLERAAAATAAGDDGALLPAHRFRTGDIALVSPTSKGESAAASETVQGVVASVTDTSVTVAFDDDEVGV
jgi:hypothetical protein